MLYKKRKAATKSSMQIERHIKGIANHRRIDILFLIDGTGPMTLDEICGHLECHFTTVSEHTARLARAGLISKQYKGKHVIHTLTPYGRTFLRFMKTFAGR